MILIRSFIALAIMLMALGSNLCAQTQGSVDHSFQNNGASAPTGATITPPTGAPGGTTIEITKIEEENTAGGWSDVTSGYTRSDNPSGKVTVKKNNPEPPLTGRKLRFHFKTNNTVSGNPGVTTTY
jgi:hypothetical protein